MGHHNFWRGTMVWVPAIGCLCTMHSRTLPQRASGVSPAFWCTSAKKLASVGVRVARSAEEKNRTPFLSPSSPSLPPLSSCPHPPLSFRPLRGRPPLPSLPLYLEVGPLKSRGSGERCKLPSGVWGRALAKIEFGAF